MILMVMLIPKISLSKNLKCNKHPIYCQIIKNKPTINRDYALKLSNIIYRVSKKYNIPPKIYTAILMQESSYVLDSVNSYCGLRRKSSDSGEVCVYEDFGMSQINYKTARYYKFDIELLLTDEEYSIESGAIVLSWFRKTYQKKEPRMWFTRFNCGTKPKVLRSTCVNYKKLVDRWM